jgi:hypothetical protein
VLAENVLICSRRGSGGIIANFRKLAVFSFIIIKTETETFNKKHIEQIDAFDYSNKYKI